MSEKTVSIRPKFVEIRLYYDNMIRHIKAILVKTIKDQENDTYTFITVNSITGIGKIKQTNIVISGCVKFDIIDKDADTADKDIMSDIFSNGLWEAIEVVGPRTDVSVVKKQIDDATIKQTRPIVSSQQRVISPGPPRDNKNPVKTSQPLDYETVRKRVAATMASLKDPLAGGMDVSGTAIPESVVANESFDPAEPMDFEG